MLILAMLVGFSQCPNPYCMPYFVPKGGYDYQFEYFQWKEWHKSILQDGKIYIVEEVINEAN